VPRPLHLWKPILSGRRSTRARSPSPVASPRVRPFAAQGKATNVWPLAILSMGESWHNLHHADSTCARHGLGRGQVDMSARVIWVLEKLGWARDVRWPTTERLARLSADATARTRT
jgi:stearoyl-CoA desaturase (Delta-9 desaturase)